MTVTNLPNIVDKLNEVQHMKEFIYEMQPNNTLHFLDAMLNRSNNSLKHTVNIPKKYFTFLIY